MFDNELDETHVMQYIMKLSLDEYEKEKKGNENEKKEERKS